MKKGWKKAAKQAAIGRKILAKIGEKTFKRILKGY